MGRGRKSSPIGRRLGFLFLWVFLGFVPRLSTFKHLGGDRFLSLLFPQPVRQVLRTASRLLCLGPCWTASRLP